MVGFIYIQATDEKIIDDPYITYCIYSAQLNGLNVELYVTAITAKVLKETFFISFLFASQV